MEFNLFHLVYKAGGNRTSKAAVENQHKLQEGSPNAIRQRKKMLNDNLIPLSLEIDRSWRLIDDGKTTSEVLET
jgi:hypothetical protein